MRFTKEQLINRCYAGLQVIAPAVQAQVGDAFNLKNLATLLVQLETDNQMSPQLVEATKYAELIPVKINFPAVVGTSHTLQRKYGVGEGQDYSGTGNDVPLAEVVYDDVSLEVRAGVVGYQYSIMELATAAQMGIQLDSDKVQAARLAYENHMSKVALYGNPAVGLQGLYNQTGVTVQAAAKDWETATPDEILADFNAILSDALEASEFDSTLAPNTVLLALSLMRTLSERRLADNLETTLFEWLSKNNLLALEGKPLVIRGKRNLETAGVGGTRRTVVYRRDPECIEMRIPQDLQFLAAQPKGLDVYFPGHYLYQGVWLKRVDSLRYMDVPQKP